MTEDEIVQYAQNLYAAYCLLIIETDNFAHDPEKHNLCSAIVTNSSGTKEYLSYSNVGSLPKGVKTFVQGSLIPSTPVHNPLIARGGMQDLHTEVRLINYLYSIGELTKSGTVHFFSTRTVCPTCAKAIGYAQNACAKHVAFMPCELKAEEGLDSIEKVHMFLAVKGTLGVVRDKTSEHGSFSIGM